MKGATLAVMNCARHFRPSTASFSPKKRPASLTGREQEILELIWSGLKNREIGQHLAISVKTVEAHRANMMKKFRVSNAAQLLKAAIRDGLLNIRSLSNCQHRSAGEPPRTTRSRLQPRR